MDAGRFRAAEGRMWASVGVTPVERTIPLARLGTDLRLQEVGDGPPIVFVHGASNSGVSWASLVAHLPGYRCVLLDRPGCGLSPPIARRLDDVEALARYSEALVTDVLDGLGLDRAHLVGTSFGGHIVLRAAAAALPPERLDRVVLLGWPVGAPIARTPLALRLASIPVLGRLGARLPASERMVRAMLRQIGLGDALASGRASPELVACFRSLLNDTDTMGNELAAGPRIVTPIGGVNDAILLAPDVLGRIAVPTTFLWGQSDPMGGAAVAERFVAQVPGATLELLPGGHAVWIDDPVHVAARIDGFLSR